MASIPGSQFIALAGESVRVVETTDGRHLPPPVAGDFNLEVWTGHAPYPKSPAPGYNGLAILGPGGDSITLVSGAFEIRDNATGGATDTLTAEGKNETIAGGPGNNDFFNADGTGDVVVGGGQDTINVYGDKATIDGVGNDLIQLWGDDASVKGGTGSDTILAYAGSAHDTIDAGSGNDLIQLWGDDASVKAGSGNDTILVLPGSKGDTIHAGSGNDSVTVLESGNTVTGGSGNDTIGLDASKDAFVGQNGRYAVQALGDHETVDGGGGTGSILAVGNHDSLTAGTGPDAISAVGDDNTISGGISTATDGGQISSFGNSDAINLGRAGTVTVGGSHDTINAGASASGDLDTVNLLYGSQELADNGQVFADTLVGFDQAAGDRIHLAPHDHVTTTTVVNGGHDTLITLSDASTILLKGVTDVDHSFFS